jgi:aspartate kinase
MVATVGTGMLKQFGTAARLFTAIAEQGISIKTMLQTPTELSMLIGIDEHDLTKAICAIYDAFIRT